jgi:hypothetical protein
MTDYKTQIKEQIEATQIQSRNAINVFLDQSVPDTERLEAFKNSGVFKETGHVQKALEILRNKNEHADIRAAALRGLINEVSNNAGLMDEVITILNNTSEPVELRIVSLSVLQAASLSSGIFPSKRPAFMNALRKLIDEDDARLKEPAMEHLAMSKDAYMQSRLLAGIEDPQKEITKPEIAIQLLSYDLHAEHYPVLRKIVKNPPNKNSKKEALRSLAADPEAKDLLWKTLKDTSEDPEIRHVCAVAIESLKPGEIQAYAKEVILNERESADFKTAMLNTLTYSADHEALIDSDFEKKLDDAEKHNSSPGYKKMYSEFKSNAQRIKSKK